MAAEKGLGVDTSEMSLDDIKTLETKIQKAKSLKIQQDLLTMKDEFISYCKDNEINIVDAVKIMGFSTQGYFRKTKPKYQDPITGTYWAGRGRMPKWYKDRLNDGYTDDELLAKSVDVSEDNEFED